jgi:AcrR family transcriptional regulator
MASRTRMGTAERREHLLNAGVELLRHRPPEEVSIEEIAEAAGVSAGLLYHYFPTKRAFIVAALERGQAQLAEELRPDPELDPIPRLDASLDVFLDRVEESASAYVAIFKRGGSDPEVAAAINAGREEQLQLLLDGLRAVEDPPIEIAITPALEAALQGWVFFCEGAVLRWLEYGGLTREQLRLLLRNALLGTIQAANAATAEGEPAER